MVGKAWGQGESGACRGLGSHVAECRHFPLIRGAQGRSLSSGPLAGGGVSLAFRGWA